MKQYLENIKFLDQHLTFGYIKMFEDPVLYNIFSIIFISNKCTMNMYLILCSEIIKYG